MNQYKIFLNNQQFQAVTLKHQTNYFELIKIEQTKGNKQFLLTSGLMYRIIIRLVNQKQFFLKNLVFNDNDNPTLKFKLINAINVKNNESAKSYLVQVADKENVDIKKFTLSNGLQEIVVNNNGVFQSSELNKDIFISALEKSWE